MSTKSKRKKKCKQKRRLLAKAATAPAATVTPPSPTVPAPVQTSRRSFFRTFGLLSAGAVIYGALSDTQALMPWFRKASDRLRYGLSIPDATQAAARSLFGISQYHTSIVPAAGNPRVRSYLNKYTSSSKVSTEQDMWKYFSRATVEASCFLAPLFQDPIQNHFTGYREVQELVQANTRKAIIALGTPTSNDLIRNLMAYREYKDPDQGHEHQLNDFVRFPILFELRRKRILSSESRKDRWYSPKSLSGEAVKEKIPNWGIVGTNGELMLPATDGEGRLLEDFLVVSSVPNIFRKECVEKSLPIMCIGGTHSVGTVALRELLEDATVLPSIESELRSQGNPKFWQAVVRVELDIQSGRAKNLSLIPRQIGKIEVNSRALMNAVEV